MLKICNIVIVGGEGDLAFRKLYPALYSLHRDKLLADCTRVICFGRGKLEEAEFLEKMREWTHASDYVQGIDEASWKTYLKRVKYYVGDATLSLIHI